MDKLFKYVNPKTVLDIGAHIGDFTKQVYYNFPTCEVMMVEANPNCESYLRLLGKPYEIIALSDKETHKLFYIEKGNSIGTGASLYKENTVWYQEGKYDTLNIPTYTLDSRNYFENKKIDLLKLDVQGSELDILNGGPKTLERTQFALIETSLVEYNQGAPMIDKIIDKMKEYKFNITDILEYHLHNGIIFQLDMLFSKE